jgi:hypothetical protein
MQTPNEPCDQVRGGAAEAAPYRDLAAAIIWLRSNRQADILGFEGDSKYERTLLRERRLDGSRKVSYDAPSGDTSATVDCYAALRCDFELPHMYRHSFPLMAPGRARRHFQRFGSAGEA